MRPVDIEWPSEPDWHLGVTGTRKRVQDGLVIFPTVDSLVSLRRLLEEAVAHGAKHLHHGVCTGWDEAAVEIVTLGGLDYLIYAHPPFDDRHLSWIARSKSHVIYKPKTYHDRNYDIAEASQVLLVGAAWSEDDDRSKHSGTWQTARMGRRLSRTLYSVDQQGDVSDVTRYEPGTDTRERSA